MTPTFRLARWRYVAAALLALFAVVGAPSGRAQTTGNPPGATYTYDSLGRLIEVRDSHGFVTDYAYDAAGNRIRVSGNSPGLNAAGIQSVTPSFGWQGSTLTVVLGGSHFTGASSIAFSGTGVTGSVTAVTGDTGITLRVTIAAATVLGMRDLLLTIPGAVLTLKSGFQVLPPVAVQVMPANPMVPPGRSQQFTAAVVRPTRDGNQTSTQVAWSVDGGDTNGTISATGLYTAPATAALGAQARVIATDPVSGATGSATITFSQAPAEILAVYNDPSRFSNFVPHGDADQIAAFLQARGYTVLDATTIRAWLEDRIRNHDRSALVAAEDALPVEALDPDPHTGQPSPNNPIRRYLLAGGRMIDIGDIPFYVYSKDANRSDFGNQGSVAILGFDAGPGSLWGLDQNYVITSAGAARGLTTILPSVRPVPVSQIDVPLATDPMGNAAAWVKLYSNVPGRGEFIRIADNSLPDTGAPQSLIDDMARLAESDVAGQVSTPLDSGITGTYSDENGAAIAGVNVLITPAVGSPSILSSTDTNGAFFAFLTPGAYKVQVLDSTHGIAAANATVSAGAITNLALHPEMIQIQPDGSFVGQGGSVALTATIHGGSTVAWGLDAGTPGTLTTDGLSATYHAPATLAADQDVFVIATDPDTAVSAMVLVHLLAPLTVNVAPSSLNLDLGASHGLQVSGAGTLRTARWLVNPPTGVDPGTITPGVDPFTITYAAPATATTPAALDVEVIVNEGLPNQATVHTPVALNPVVVTVSPLAKPLLRPNESETVNATVTGAADAAVTWSIQGPGTIDPVGGSYTAPAAIAPGSHVDVIATSHADPTKSNQATIRIEPAITIAINPPAPTVHVDDGVAFTATVVNAAHDPTVTWSIVSGPGTIDPASGAYHVGSPVTGTPTVAVIQATSNEEPSISTQATVTIPEVKVAVNVIQATLHANGALSPTFTVTGTPNTALTYQFTGPGTFVRGTYTAPGQIPNPVDATVTATSTVAPDKSATTTFHLMPPARVTLTPQNPISPLGGQISFQATVTNVTDPSVSYSLSDASGALGTVAEDGTYTAPGSLSGTPQTVVVRATSIEDGTGFAESTITLGPVGVTVGAAGVILAPGDMTQLTANVTGAIDTAVDWAVDANGAGKVDPNGVFTAPAPWTRAQTSVTAMSRADATKQGSILLDLVRDNSLVGMGGPAQSSSTVTVPITVFGTLNLQSFLFDLSVAPRSNPPSRNVVRITGIAGGPGVTPAPQDVPLPAGGVSTIHTGGAVANGAITGHAVLIQVTLSVPFDANGPYDLTIKNPSMTDTSGNALTVGDMLPATVVVAGPAPPPITVTVAPDPANVAAGGTQAFTATVTGTGDANVVWSVKEGPAGGTITPDGHYTAPNGSGTFHVVAASEADPSVTGSATVNVSPATGGSILNQNLIVNSGAEAGAPGAAVPGWATTAPFEVIAYGADNSAAAPTPGSGSPGPGNRGAQLFAGGETPANSVAGQQIDVGSQAANIDGNSIFYTVDGFFGGSGRSDDSATLVLLFLDATGSPLGTATVGGVRAADRNDSTGLIEKQSRGPVPAGTRTISLQLNMDHFQGNRNTAFADSLSLILNQI